MGETRCAEEFQVLTIDRRNFRVYRRNDAMIDRLSISCHLEKVESVD